MAEQQKPDGTKKTFSLKKSETGLLHYIKQQHQATFAAVLANMAAERLGYPVTQFTRFELSADFDKIIISELTPQDIAAMDAADRAKAAEAEGGGGIRTAQ